MGYGGLMRNLQHGANNIHAPANNPRKYFVSLKSAERPLTLKIGKLP